MVSKFENLKKRTLSAVILSKALQTVKTRDSTSALLNDEDNLMGVTDHLRDSG